MRSRETELFYYYLALDLLVLNASLLFSAWFNFNLLLGEYYHISPMFLHANLSWIISYFSFTKKNLYIRDRFSNRIWRITQRQIIFVLVAASLAFIFFKGGFSRMFFIEYTILFYFLKIISYWIFYRYVRYKRSRGIYTARAAIVGCNKTGMFLKRIMESNVSLGYYFSGFICSNSNNVSSYLGHPDELEAIIEKKEIDIVFYTISFFNGDNAEFNGKEILKICNRKGIRLRFVPQDQRWFRNRMNMESIGEFVVINPQEVPLDNIAFRFQKRLFDIVFSSFVIVCVLSWMIPVLFLLIKLESKGPVFFVQKRTGMNNKTFNCLKFRSMVVNQQADEKQATMNDDRFTRVGRFIRRTNIDEFPQFINVFCGSMSVVGPRPHMLKHTEEYSKIVSNYLVRHYVKPGVTGWAQVRGLRGEIRHVEDLRKRTKADMEYIKNWTFLWDIKIILLTVFGADTYKNAM